MSESLFHGDETGWRVFETVEGKTGRRWYLWVILSESVHYYRVASTRATTVPREHFAGLDERIEEAFLVCDRYSAYKCLAKEMPALWLAFCWPHVRRDFIEAARRFPAHQDWMFDWIEAIPLDERLPARLRRTGRVLSSRPGTVAALDDERGTQA